jgi:CHAD domain-containing protein
MAFQLHQDETVGEAAPRLGSERVEKALAGLRDARDGTRDEAVHSARKRLKETRAVLRLVGGGLDRKTRKRDDALLRDAGRSLSSARDAWVLVETLDKLNGGQAATPLRQRLLARHKEAAGGETPVEAYKALEEALDRTRGWAPEGDVEVLAEGLQHTYAAGREAFAAAKEAPTDGHLHDWRKRVKDLWYAVQLVEPAWPGPFGALAGELHALSDLLGDDHDLAVFAEQVQPAGALADTLARRRDELRAEALQLGARIYAEKPRAFTRRVITAYRVWRSIPSSG